MRKKTLSWMHRLQHWLIPATHAQNDDLMEHLKQWHIHGLINTDTRTLLEGVLSFAPMRVGDIFLPKTQMVSISVEAKPADILKIITASGHSRFPVTGENPDDIIGILHAKDLLRFPLPLPASFHLQDLLRPASFVPESKPLPTLLNEFRKNRNHLAMVVDEYGSVSGLVTLEDITEVIMGNIEDEFDVEEDLLIKMHSQGRYTLKGHTPIEDFNEQLHTDFSDQTYDTIAGIITSLFGHLPKRGETIHYHGFEFKILHADARRIHVLECTDKRSQEKPTP